MLEALFVGNVARFSQAWCPESQVQIPVYGYTIFGFAPALLRLFWIGFAGRLAAAALVFMDGRAMPLEIAMAACGRLLGACRRAPPPAPRSHGAAAPDSENPTSMKNNHSGTWYDLPDGFPNGAAAVRQPAQSAQSAVTNNDLTLSAVTMSHSEEVASL